MHSWVDLFLHTLPIPSNAGHRPVGWREGWAALIKDCATGWSLAIRIVWWAIIRGYFNPWFWWERRDPWFCWNTILLFRTNYDKYGPCSPEKGMPNLRESSAAEELPSETQKLLWNWPTWKLSTLMVKNVTSQNTPPMGWTMHGWKP